MRRRLWRRRRGSDAAAAPALAVTAASDEAATAAAAAAAAVVGESAAAEAAALAAAREVREAREAEARKKAVKAFLSLVLDLLRWGWRGFPLGGLRRSLQDRRRNGAVPGRTSRAHCEAGAHKPCGPARRPASCPPLFVCVRSRRQVWTLVPWDPAAPFLLARKHSQVYQELQVPGGRGRAGLWLGSTPGMSQLPAGRMRLTSYACPLPAVPNQVQAQAYERRLFMADQEAPPSQLRPGRTLLQVRRGTLRGAPATAVVWRHRGLGWPGPCSVCAAAAELLPTLPPYPLQDLLCAAMHARAAYGFPLAAGLMSDVPSYIRLQTVQPLT